MRAAPYFARTVACRGLKFDFAAVNRRNRGGRVYFRANGTCGSVFDIYRRSDRGLTICQRVRKAPAGGVFHQRKQRSRDIPVYLFVSQAEHEQIQERMAEAGTNNMSAFIRKMALNGYVLHVDLSPVRELVSLQRRCSNYLNQVAITANTYGGIYPEEIAALQKDYAALWEPLSDLLTQLAGIVKP
jgi:CheY-like chemotaxis protein